MSARFLATTAVAALTLATAALLSFMLEPTPVEGLVTAGATAFLLGGPLLGWLALGRIARGALAFLLAAAVVVPLLESAVYPGTDDVPALSPPAVDWILPAGWLGAGLCVLALLLDRMPRRTPLWPLWLDRSGRVEPARWRRVVGVWALAGAVSCASVAWLITPDGVAAAYPSAVASVDAVPLPVGWVVDAEDRGCPRGRCGAHEYEVVAPAGLPGWDAVADFGSSLRAAGWTRPCRPVAGVWEWGPRCVHLHREGLDPLRFTAVVDDDPPDPCDDHELFSVRTPRQSCSRYPDPTVAWLLDRLAQQMDGLTRSR